MPKLLSTHIIPNHPSFFDHPQPINEYLTKEVTAGRMSGPFTQLEIEAILRGPFQSSPFIVSVQPQAPGEPNKIRVCRHLSKATKTIPSVNSFISKDDFPTRFDIASRVADIVSIPLSGSFICHGIPLPSGFLPYHMLIIFLPGCCGPTWHPGLYPRHRKVPPYLPGFT
jgi:hypothetical protein